MTHDHHQPRSYGGWRRSRSIGLLGLGPTATLILLGCAAALLLVAAVSLKALVFVAPPAALAGAAGLARVGGVPLALLAVQRLRWWHGTTAGHTGYRAEVVLRHTGVLQLPGTLAATELLSAEDGYGGRYGLVRDRRTGFLTATLRVVPASTWLAEPGDVDGWVASWGGWLACLGYLPALRWVSVTAATAPDPGCTLTGRVAAATDPAAPRPALQIMDELVATAPAAAADVDTRVSITFDPALFPSRPGTTAAAVTETGRALPGLESALGSCGVAVLGRARAADIAGAVRTAFDPAVRGEVSRLLAAGTGPALPEQLNWASACRPAPKKPGTATGTAAAAPSAGPGARPPATTSPPTCWPGSPHPAGSPNGSPCNTGRCPPRQPPGCWKTRSAPPSSAANTPAAPAATSPPATPTTTPAPARPPTRKPRAPGSPCSGCTSPSPSPTRPSSPAR